MPKATKTTKKKARVTRQPSRASGFDAGAGQAEQVAWVLDWLERHGSAKYRDGLTGYGIVTRRAFGVSMAEIKKLGALVGRLHPLASALWASGWYEARLLVAFVADPEQLSPAQLDRYCRDFDNWAICDTLCFQLFDRSPHAFSRVQAWAARPEEFVKRAAFALLASLALHDRRLPDQPFLDNLPRIESAAGDSRNFVKKGVSWALRACGRRSPALHTASLELARKLAASEDSTQRWVGKDALKDLGKPGLRVRGAPRAGATSQAEPKKAARRGTTAAGSAPARKKTRRRAVLE